MSLEYRFPAGPSFGLIAIYWLGAWNVAHSQPEVLAKSWTAAEYSTAPESAVFPAGTSKVRVETIEGRPHLRLIPSADLYTRSALTIRCSAGTWRWLSLEYHDAGIGMIVTTPRLPDERQWGVARVNSKSARTAVFDFEKRPADGFVRIEGIDFLHRVTWSTARPVLPSTPTTSPALEFVRPSERVATACVDGPSPANLDRVLAGLRNHLPALRSLGFNGVETFVRWGWVEREPGRFDWSYFDRVLAEMERHGMKWSPMLLAGSGYALPSWWRGSSDDIGFRCLEHGVVHDTQSIFAPRQAEIAQRFIAEFGKRYGSHPALLALRLGPSGDFGEAQYPARGPGYGWRRDNHTHIGYWAGDAFAVASFRKHLVDRYVEIQKLNDAWKTRHPQFDAVTTFLPNTALERRQRLDIADWYMNAMSDWCNRWATWSRQAMPKVSLHQSAGGWGPVEIGTDYTAIAKGMAAVGGGLRLTNEGDDFVDNFTITRMASSAARFYGVKLGYEPAGFGSKRGVMARLFNAVTNDASHLFYYQGNLFGNDQAVDAWLRHGKLLDRAALPLVDVVALYPDTSLKLDDEVLRYRFASTFFTVARAVRERCDFDYASERMILDGALDRYKVLLFLWGPFLERPVLERIDRWIRDGGTAIVCPGRRGHPVSVEGQLSISDRWRSGDTGKGRYIVFPGDPIPSHRYANFIHGTLLQTPSLHPRTLAALRMPCPTGIYWSLLQSGEMALLNFGDDAAVVCTPRGKRLEMAPYSIALD